MTEFWAFVVAMNAIRVKKASAFLMIDLPIVVVYCTIKLNKPVKAFTLLVWEIKRMIK